MNNFFQDPFMFASPSYASSSSTSITIPDHNKRIHIDRAIANLTIDGHNNHIILEVDIPNLSVSGHNNTIMTNHQFSELCKADNMVVSGHNNRVELIEAINLAVSGHNNSFQSILCGNLQNMGFNNKFREVSQTASSSFGHSSHSEPSSNRSNFSHSNGHTTFFQNQTSNYPNSTTANAAQQLFSTVNMEGMPDFVSILNNVSSLVNNLYTNGQPNGQGFNFVNMGPSSSGSRSGSGPIFFNFSTTNQSSGPTTHFFQGGQEPSAEENSQAERERLKAIKRIINSYSAYKYTEGEEEVTCTICLEKLKAGNIVKSLNCCHTFHKKCIDHWLYVKLKCPLCQASIL